MKQKHILILLTALLAVILIGLVILAVRLTAADVPPATDPSQSTPSTAPTTVPSTTPTTIPTAPTEPLPTEPIPTEPIPTEPEMVGSLYTRQELEAMSTVGSGYGPGVTANGVRPPYAIQAQNSYGQYGGNFIAPDDGSVYLTFDCGYEFTATNENGQPYRVTQRILDVLKAENVKAVFFVTLSYVRNQPDLVQRMIDEGHAVGNHSVNHPSMPELTIDEMVSEVMGLHTYMLEHFGYEMTLFRPPEGTFSVQSLAVVQSLGYQNVHWSFAYADYYTDNQPTYQEAMEIVTGRHHSGAIYLLHAVSTTNAQILPEVIAFFRAQGYTLKLFQ